MSSAFAQDFSAAARSQTRRAEVATAVRRETPCTARLDAAEQLSDSVLRTVLSFNRQPSRVEVETALATVFGGSCEIIPGSFRLALDKRRVSSRPTVCGYVKPKQATLPADAVARMEEKASNTYMDDEDHAWWLDEERGELIKLAQEDLSDILDAATAHLSPRGQGSRRPLEMLASVQDEVVGSANTEYLAFVDPEKAELAFGVRVGDDHVLERESGEVVEITQDLVVASETFKGMDRVETAAGEMDVKEPVDTEMNSLSDYYRKIYGYNSSFFDRWDEIIKGRAYM